MCGIAGFVDFKQVSDVHTIARMIQTLSHRGPDDTGTELLFSPYAKIGLGQARLSIIDLSAGGHQPMNYKHWTIVFNGEIYNYAEIKKELVTLGHQFKSESDTEVILHAFEAWGADSVHRFIGMFAFVIYDAQSQKLIVIRDRAGVKPFFYFWHNNVFLFASELKALHVHPAFEKKIDQAALQLYFEQVHHGYIPAPYTIFEHTYKLKPGHIIYLHLKDKSLNISRYWDVESFYRLPRLQASYEETKQNLKDLLKSACEYRMVADVPVGVFLSGGYDSTAVTAILQSGRTEKLKTFTIGFEEGNNEAPFAKETAKFLGTDHTEFICTTLEAQAIIPDLPFFFDEPFADSSAIPTILVSQLARKQVTVALSADAGDEVFAGYDSYAELSKNLQKLNQVPDILKPFASSIAGFGSGLIPKNRAKIKHRIKGISQAIQKNRLNQSTELFRLMNCLPKSYQQSIFLMEAPAYESTTLIDTLGFHNEIEIAMAIDYQMYLQNDILTKVDRATMSVSLEGREPLLDHRLVEFAAQMPFEYKYDGITSKKILKDIVHDFVPKKMMDRPKSGFSLPIYNWLNNELSYLIDEYLNEKSIAKSGLFNPNFIKEQVTKFKSGNLHYKPFIWKLLMFQIWYEKWMN